MNWVPQFLDRPVVFFFSVQTWQIVLLVVYTLLIIGASQMQSLIVALSVGYIIKKVETNRPDGFISHWYYRHLGFPMKGFPARPGTDRRSRI